jgi:protein O-GlcNAc transferase
MAGMTDDPLLQSRIQQAAALASAGSLDEAGAIYSEILAAHANQPQALHQLGIVRWRQGRNDEAIELIKKAIAILPYVPQFLGNLGVALTTNGDLAAAVEAFQRSLALAPNSLLVLANLGNTFRLQDNFDAAVDHLQAALRLQPNFAVAQFNYGVLCKDLGELDAAITALRRAVEIDLRFALAHGALLYTQLFHERCSPTEIFLAHLQWDELQTAQWRPQQPMYSVSRTANRPLRIGYVSAYFRDHAINFFIEPILRAHDRSQFEIFCYDDVPSPDAVTDRLRSLGHPWRNVYGLTDQRVCQQIQNDAIDILIDPIGHLDSNRLFVFARKPAPVQITMIGYQATTGMAAMDYRVTDAWADPPGETDGFHTEKLIRLPDAFFCWQAPTEAPPVAPPPSITSGYVTFGSFNNFCKIRPITLQAWAALLSAVPNSRLHLLTPNSTYLRQKVEHAFQSQGIDPGRLRFLSVMPRAEYLAQYHQIDIALDSFPFNGHTTVCDALWMGVPVVMLAGSDYRSRYGGSVLRNLGLERHIARQVDEYIEIATQLASDAQQRTLLRQSLRNTMHASVLMDADGYTRNFESALRDVWNRWVAERDG